MEALKAYLRGDRHMADAYNKEKYPPGENVELEVVMPTLKAEDLPTPEPYPPTGLINRLTVAAAGVIALIVALVLLVILA